MATKKKTKIRPIVVLECRKCGCWTSDKIYCSGMVNDYSRTKPVYAVKRKACEYGGSEHLHITCSGCGFKWAVDCADKGVA